MIVINIILNIYIISTFALFCYVRINILSFKESSILSSSYSFTVTLRFAVIIFGAGLATILKHRVNILGLLWREKCRQNGVSSPYLAVMWPVYNFFTLKTVSYCRRNCRGCPSGIPCWEMTHLVVFKVQKSTQKISLLFFVGSCTSNKCDEEKIYSLLNGQCHVSCVRISTRIFIGQITESCYQTMLERNMMTFIFNLSTLSTGLQIDTKKILFNFWIFFEKQTSLSSSVLGSRNCHSYRGSSSSRSSWAGGGGEGGSQFL